MFESIDLDKLETAVSEQRRIGTDLKNQIQDITEQVESLKKEEEELVNEKSRVENLLALKEAANLVKKNRALITETKKAANTFWEGLYKAKTVSEKFSGMTTTDVGNDAITIKNAMLFPKKMEFYLENVKEENHATISAGKFDNAAFETICEEGKGKTKECSINNGMKVKGKLDCFFPSAMGKAIYPECSDEDTLGVIKEFYDNGNEALEKFEADVSEKYKEVLSSVEGSTASMQEDLSGQLTKLDGELLEIRDKRIATLKDQIKSAEKKLKGRGSREDDE